MKKKFMLTVLAAVLLVTAAGQALHSNYETGDMVWTTENGGVLVLSPFTGPGSDVTVTFTCDKPYSLGDGVQGITDTMTGLGYDYNGHSSQDPTVTFTFSQDVEQVKLSIHDLDTFESLRSAVPLPDSVYNEYGFLFISGDSVRTSASNAHGDLMYDAILSTETLGFRFDQNLSSLGLVNLQFTVIPEPATLCLLGIGGSVLRKRRA